MFLKLKDELDSERSSCRTVAEKCQEAGQPDEAKRWLELDALYGEYRKKLAANNLTELNEARANAIQSGEIRETFQNGADCEAIRVLGAADLNRLQKDVFAALGERVEFWVFAPEEKEELFDDFGCVAPEKWERYEIPLADEQLFQVDSPPEQGEAAAYLTRELSKIYDQDGVLRNKGLEGLSPETLMRMDWLCDNVDGRIPGFDELLPGSREMVRLLGLYRDDLSSPVKEEKQL